MKGCRRFLRLPWSLNLIALLAVAVLLTPPGYAQERERPEQCVDFNDRAVGEEVEAEFVQDGFLFRAVDGGRQSLDVTDTDYGPGLVIAATGLDIGLPLPTSRAVLRTVSYNPAPLHITAYSDEGAAVDEVTAPSEPEGILHEVTLNDQAITLLHLSGGQNEAVLVEICIQPETETPPPERLPDLVLSDLYWETVEEGHVLVITAQAENVGDAPTSEEVIVHAESRAAEWSGEGVVPELDSGQSESVTIELEIPDGVRGQTHLFLVVVDPDNRIAERDEENNVSRVEVPVPNQRPRVDEDEEDGGQAGVDQDEENGRQAEGDEDEENGRQAEGDEDEENGGEDEGDGDFTTVILAVIIAVGVVGSGLALTTWRITKIRARKEWQEKAKEEEPPETCQPCTRHCRKIEGELELARRKITHLALVAYDPVSGEKSQETQVEGKVVDDLNKALRARRQRQELEEVQRLVTPVAGALSQQITEWLRPERAPRDVSVAGHLAGGKVTFQFILYHCRRRGNVNVWEQEDKWKATVEDERDEAVTTLRGLDAAEPEMPQRVIPELAQRLMDFIENVAIGSSGPTHPTS